MDGMGRGRAAMARRRIILLSSVLDLRLRLHVSFGAARASWRGR